MASTTTQALRALMRGCNHMPSNKATGTILKGKQDESEIIIENPKVHTKLPASLDFFQTNSLPPTYETVTSTCKKLKSINQHQEEQDNENDDVQTELQSLLPSEELRKAIKRLGITTPTGIQKRAIPSFLLGNDVIAIAPTGSGKTLAYALPLLQFHIDKKQDNVQSIILSPTRELALQISRVVSRVLLLADMKKQIRLQTIITNYSSNSNNNNDLDIISNIIIATPQTLVSLIEMKNVNVSNVKHVVLDEADELLNHNFIKQIDTIISNLQLPKVHLFSATLSPTVQHLAQTLQTSSHKVTISASAYGGNAAISNLSDKIKQTFHFVGGRNEQGKILAIRTMFRNGLKPPILIFIQSKERATELFRELIYDGIHVDAVHGDRSVKARENAVQRFRSGKVWVLIATDVLARGLDFKAVNTVINYDVPANVEAYVHRVGRTGRCPGRIGTAVTLFTEEDKNAIGKIATAAKASGAEGIPDWLIKLGHGGNNGKGNNGTKGPSIHVPKRGRIGGPNRSSLKGGNGKKRKVTDDDGDEVDDKKSIDEVVVKKKKSKKRKTKKGNINK